ncbi:putative mycofactocin biosynthesis glycosyltransferase MftF [Geobacter sp. OR-1]|uniref:mycofactocin biosynthesis glycosyltransferase MftF n=1 Tax=Geobacter sp. OR-1 TaxID=1266765 RepID=UPI00054380C5|nr:mycofactocin biosynthesis glycosyltransferase MftF [Geobacter sp. OR-1]GAM11454.1 putative mycofactocin biosynthesis glycosyltransferase MftF [Geobacter sp. OR-1]
MMYSLAPHVELAERGGEHLLVSRTPLCVLRLNRSLRELVARGLDGPITPVSLAEQEVLEQLAGKGFVERLRESSEQPTDQPAVSIVIPVKDREDELARCLASLNRIKYPKERLQVIVVDDGSTDLSPVLAQLYGAKVVPSGGTGRGPAAARNVGARAATGEILAFIDSDCTASPGWLSELIPAFSDPRLAAVGGYVDGMCRESAVDRYESVMSSLSLGSRERTGSSGDDTFYLPSCNLLVRRGLFNAVGGFRDEMHVGEDVDLTWRLRDQGWTIGYLPAGRIYHEHRSSVRSFMSRRFDYGTSEGTLQRLHPQRRKRMVIPPLLALLLALGLATPFTGGWSLLLAFCVLALDVTVVKARLVRRNVPVGLTELFAGRLRALGSLVYYLCFHLVRYYSLMIIAAALFFPMLWLLFAAALACAGRVDYSVRQPDQPFPAFIAIYALEHLAYGSGVFWGCLSRKTFASYRVVLLRQMEASA